MKQIQLPQQTIEALLKGASMFLFPIDEDIEITDILNDGLDLYYSINHTPTITSPSVFIENFLPLQVDDEFWVAEEWLSIKERIYTKSEAKLIPKEYLDVHYNRLNWIPASEMTEVQSRLKGKVVGIQLKRVDEITKEDCKKLGQYAEFTTWSSNGGEYPPPPAQDYAYTFDGKVGSSDYKNNLKQWLNQQYGEGFYENNPYIPLYAVEMKG